MDLAFEVLHCLPDEVLQRADKLPQGGSVELSEAMAYYQIRAQEQKDAQPKKKIYKR